MGGCSNDWSARHPSTCRIKCRGVGCGLSVVGREGGRAHCPPPISFHVWPEGFRSYQVPSGGGGAGASGVRVGGAAWMAADPSRPGPPCPVPSRFHRVSRSTRRAELSLAGGLTRWRSRVLHLGSAAFSGSERQIQEHRKANVPTVRPW